MADTVRVQVKFPLGQRRMETTGVSASSVPTGSSGKTAHGR